MAETGEGAIEIPGDLKGKVVDTGRGNVFPGVEEQDIIRPSSRPQEEPEEEPARPVPMRKREAPADVIGRMLSGDQSVWDRPAPAGKEPRERPEPPDPDKYPEGARFLYGVRAPSITDSSVDGERWEGRWQLMTDNEGEPVTENGYFVYLSPKKGS